MNMALGEELEGMDSGRKVLGTVGIYTGVDAGGGGLRIHPFFAILI
ncbi:hypothetical protein COLO4_36021 [Corchorus olitorius]|uniref:Uncharacterized protein n=1 Tax=Corchorus olitorius TaxID=93759 RepID=A0A1R3GB91_9ROSI|nr:hypothetical protein COLO4_36022 [Corchorus olitorius]OMO55363.1 hypothetical protein COLO4_36021 [Corchorus olitorius]